MLSCTLFNPYFHYVSTPTDPISHVLLYADELPLLTQYPEFETAAKQQINNTG